MPSMVTVAVVYASCLTAEGGPTCKMGISDMIVRGWAGWNEFTKLKKPVAHRGPKSRRTLKFQSSRSLVD